MAHSAIGNPKSTFAETVAYLRHVVKLVKTGQPKEVLAPAIESPITSLTVISTEASNFTIDGQMDGYERILTVDTGVSHLSFDPT